MRRIFFLYKMQNAPIGYARLIIISCQLKIAKLFPYLAPPRRPFPLPLDRIQNTRELTPVFLFAQINGRSDHHRETAGVQFFNLKALPRGGLRRAPPSRIHVDYPLSIDVIGHNRRGAHFGGESSIFLVADPEPLSFGARLRDPGAARASRLFRTSTVSRRVLRACATAPRDLRMRAALLAHARPRSARARSLACHPGRQRELKRLASKIWVFLHQRRARTRM